LAIKARKHVQYYGEFLKICFKVFYKNETMYSTFLFIFIKGLDDNEQGLGNRDEDIGGDDDDDDDDDETKH